MATAKHARPRRTLRPAIKTTVAAFVLLALTALAGSGLAAVHVTPASAATRSPSQITCEQFATWEVKPTGVNLDELVADSAKLGKSYLKADLLELAADASSPSKNAWKYVTVAEQYAGEDCLGYGA